MLRQEEILKKKGLKVTPQRTMILNELRNNGHLSIEEIYNAIKPNYSSISLATVYKNIDSLREADIIGEVYMPEGKNKYEIKQDSHAHFFCTKCGALKDLHIDKKNIEKIYNGSDKVEDFTVVFSGECAECKGRGV